MSEFPCGPVVRGPNFHCQGPKFAFCLGYLRSHKPRAVSKRKKKEKEKKQMEDEIK